MASYDRTHHAVEQPVDFATITLPSGQKALARSEDIYRNAGRVNISQLSSQGSLSGLLSNTGQFADFFLQGIDQDFVTKMFLKVTIANNDGSNAATLVPSYLMLSSVQHLINGSDMVYQTQAESLHAQLLYYSQEQVTIAASMANWYPGSMSNWYPYYTTAAPPVATNFQQTIGTTSNATYYIPIDSWLNLNESGVPLRFMSPPRIRIYFASNVLTSNSAMTTLSSLSVTSLQLFIQGITLRNESQARLAEQVRKATSLYTCTADEKQVISLSSGSISAGTQINQTLTSLAGNYNSIICYLRAANPTQELVGQYNFSSGSSSAILPSLRDVRHHVEQLEWSSHLPYQSGQQDAGPGSVSGPTSQSVLLYLPLGYLRAG